MKDKDEIDKQEEHDDFGGFSIFHEFKNGVFYEDLYKKYGVTEDELIWILQKNIKGRYNYKSILSGGPKAQMQFLKHLKNRWNPLEPDAPWKDYSPYIPSKQPVLNKKKKEE